MPEDATLNARDLEHWGRMPGWHVKEAAALLLGFDPHRVSSEQLTKSEYDQFVRLKSLLVRCRTMGLLQTPVDPRTFVEWAKDNGLGVPEALLQQVTTTESLTDWRAKAEEYGRQIRKLRKRRKKKRSGENDENWSPKSLYKVLLSVAEQEHGYHRYRRNSASKVLARIVNDANFTGPSDDTIRKGLERAFDTVDEDRRKPKRI